MLIAHSFVNNRWQSAMTEYLSVKYCSWCYYAGFKKEQIFADKRLHHYAVEVKYKGALQKSNRYDLSNKGVKIFYPDLINSNPEDTVSEFQLPLTAHRSQILTNFTDGIYLRVDPVTNDVLALRKSLVQVFFKSHCQPTHKKLNRDSEVKVFSLASVYELIQNKSCLNESSEVELVIGQDPTTHHLENYSAVVTVKSIAAADGIAARVVTFDSGEPALLSTE